MQSTPTYRYDSPSNGPSKGKPGIFDIPDETLCRVLELTGPSSFAGLGSVCQLFFQHASRLVAKYAPGKPELLLNCITAGNLTLVKTAIDTNPWYLAHSEDYTLHDCIEHAIDTLPEEADHSLADSTHFKVLEYLLSKSEGLDAVFANTEYISFTLYAMKAIINNKPNLLDFLFLNYKPDNVNIDEDHNIDYLDIYSTFLLAAIQKHNLGCMKVLLKHGASPNACDEEGEFPLELAIDSFVNPFEAVKMLIEAGACVDDEHEYRAQCLLYKVFHLGDKSKKVDILTLLLKAGVDPNTHLEGNPDATAVQKSVSLGETEMFALLVQHGGAFEFGGEISYLADAAKAGHLGIVEEMLKQGARVDLPGNRCIQTPVVAVVKASSTTPPSPADNNRSITISKYERILELLIEAGATLHKELDSGFDWTLLHVAAEDNNLDMAKVIIKHTGTALFDKVDQRGKTPLLASRSEEFRFCLIDAGATFDIPESKRVNGRCAIHIAVIEGNVELVEYLLCIGVSVNVKDASGKTPLKMAVERDDMRIIPLLLEAGAEIGEDGN